MIQRKNPVEAAKSEYLARHRRYAVNDEGEYLHFGGSGTTRNRNYAWFGYPRQFRELKRRNRRKLAAFHLKELVDGR